MQLRVTVAAAARDTAEGAVVTAADWAADILSGAADADRYFTGDLRSAAEMIFSGYDFDRFSVELQVETARFSVELQVKQPGFQWTCRWRQKQFQWSCRWRQ